MLFDLTGRRRGVIRVVYALLAVLLAGGLLVGVGTATGINPFGEGGGQSLEDQSEQRIERAQAVVSREPGNAAALADLVRARVDAANATTDQQTGRYSEAGRAQLRRADQQWGRYLELDPDALDGRVAQRMVIAYGQTGLDQPRKAADAQAIVVDAAVQRARASDQDPPFEPTYIYAQLLYQAGDDTRGDLAARRAASLAPSGQRSQVRQQLEQLKTQRDAAAAAGGGAGGGGAGGGVQVPSG